MRRQAIDKLVYDAMFPRPKVSDPHDFNEVLTRYLVFEVRQEVHSFYGHLDTQEAKYPGLDYSHSIHRIRLSRWPWHRRLFRAFNALRLTPTEIGHLTKWEGTKWAKDRYEKEQNISIQDTAADGMPDYRARGSRPPNKQHSTPYGVSTGEPFTDRHAHVPRSVSTDDHTIHPAQLLPAEERVVSVTLSATPDPSLSTSATTAVPAFNTDDIMHDVETVNSSNDSDNNQEDSDDGVTQSIGLQLNERLRQRVAAHNAGDTSQPLDEDWEQWLKAVIETGDLTMINQHIGRLSDLPFVYSYSSQPHTAADSQTSVPEPSVSSTSTSTSTGDPNTSNIIPPQFMNAARQGSWEEIPEFLHHILRQTVDMELVSQTGVAPLSGVSAESNGRQYSSPSTWRRTYSDLRLPGQ